MKYVYMLIFFGVVGGVTFNSSFALTPDECNQRGGSCICIAHPGADPVCTETNTILLAFKKEKQKANVILPRYSEL